MDIKALIAAGVVATVVPLTSLAASHRDPGEVADRIAEKLDLDDTRAQQVEWIMTDYYESKEQLSKQKDERLKSVLSEEEMDKLEAMWKQGKKDRWKDKKMDAMKDKQGMEKERMEKKDGMEKDMMDKKDDMGGY